jgi:hypothetical protein
MKFPLVFRLSLGYQSHFCRGHILRLINAAAAAGKPVAGGNLRKHFTPEVKK